MFLWIFLSLTWGLFTVFDFLKPAHPAMTRKAFQALGPDGFHRVDYSEWGDPANPRVLICVHGLTRNSRDFDFLAHQLAREYRVIAPDIAGRGTSEWLSNPLQYNYPLYLSDMAALIARANVEQVDWLGTSMGGIIGMMLAAQRGHSIRRLILNDVGSVVTGASLMRLAAYVKKMEQRFASLQAVELYFRKTHAPFGALTDAQWQHMAEHGATRNSDGSYSLNCDPAIYKTFSAIPFTDIDLSLYWNQVRCPTLVIRGEDSDLLLPLTVDRMRQSHPNMRSVEISNCGHAPALMDDEQIAIIRHFLLT
jgi:pimeloyl-ACP methyl ester carboxylesterase